MSTWSPPREPPARRAALADWYARVGHFTARSHHHATYVARRAPKRHRVHQGERLPAEYSVGHSTRHDRPDIGGCGGLPCWLSVGIGPSSVRRADRQLFRLSLPAGLLAAPGPRTVAHVLPLAMILLCVVLRVG